MNHSGKLKLNSLMCLVKVPTHCFDLDLLKLPAGINSSIRNNIFVSILKPC